MHGIHGTRIGCRLAEISVFAFLVLMIAPSLARPQSQAQADGEKPKESTPSSYDQMAPALLGRESFQAMMARDKADKESVMARQKKLLEERYDLTPRPDGKVTMSRGKPIQVGPTAKLPEGLTWEQLTAMASDEIREKGLFPKGFLPLPHPKHEVGGMVFPQMEIKQFGRLERFDVDFDLPEHFLPEFPPAIYLTTRMDLGDVSQGKVVTEDNFQELFAGILNAKDLVGLRLLVTQFPQQQFNATADRKTDKPDGMRGVSCFDCHVNGHTSGATHLVGDIRPQSHRRRIDTTSLRGVNIQRLFGSQRALKSVEDFTEFEQRGAYFDGDPVAATAKGVNPLERGSQVHFMAEVQEFLAFPPRHWGLTACLTRGSSPRIRPRCAVSNCSSARHNAPPATRRLTTPTTRCTTCRSNDSTRRRRSTAWWPPHRGRSRPSPCAASRSRRRTSTTAAC